MFQPTLLRFGIPAFAVCATLVLYLLAYPPVARTVSPNVVISQVYGGGGNSGAPFQNDFIELFNRSSAPINLSGWSVQYASATGTSWSKTDLAGTLQPGQYLLIQQAGSVSMNGMPLPTPDVSGTISMSTTAGKVALVNNTTLLSGSGCPFAASVVDFVGYGSTANCSETMPAPAPSSSNMTGVRRAANGCTDTDNNSSDFATATPTPRNTASPTNVCGAPTNPTGTGAANPSTVASGSTTLLTVTVTPGTNPTSTGITVTGDLTAIGGSATQQFFDNGTNGDMPANDNTFSFLVTVASNTTAGMKSLPITVADAQSRSSNTTISLTVVVAPSPGNIVISQIYGGGGNSGAPFQNDFIEIFNRSMTTINISGWSVQYASAASGSWQVTALSGSLAPGQYYLIQEGSSGTNGSTLPTPDATGTIALSSTAGKVALVNTTAALSGTCPFGASVIDFVGYGSTATCFEGAGPTTAPSSTTAILRANQGCTDTTNNTADFTTGAPTPRNTASPTNICGAPTNPTGVGTANPSTVIAGNTTLLTVAVTPGTNPASTGINVTADLTSISGSATQQFFDNGTNGDMTAGDNVFSFQANVPINASPGMKTLPINIADAQARTSTTSISLQVRAPVAAGAVVISQVYGGGGNSSAAFTNDYIELFNRSNQPIDLNGLSVQYAGATGASWQKTDLAGTLQPKQYFLIQQASGGANGAPLPTPDTTGTIALAATAGKVVLLNTTTQLINGTSCPSGASVIDLVGYGSSANCFEGSGPTTAPSATNAVFRAANGCFDSDNNVIDFAAAVASPRNTASPLATCAPATPPTGVGAANPNPIIAGNATLLTVTVTPGANPASIGITVIGNLSNIGLAAGQPFFDNGTNGDVTPNDNVFSFQANLASNLPPGLKSLPINLADAQLRTSATTISLQVRAPVAAGAVVISQVYGGGGNSGAPFTHDFIELFNRSNQPVDLSGLSVQYAGATGTTWQKTDLTGTLQPGQYFLIQGDSGGSNGAPLPMPNVTGTIALASTAGKVGLFNTTALIASGTSCPSSGVVDFVGYGSSATCFEGAGPAPAPSSANAALRSGAGCADTNNNNLNFATGPPNPRNTAAPFNFCGGGGALFNANSVKLVIRELPTCIGAGDRLTVEARLTNNGTRNQTDNPGSEFVAKLSPTLVALPDSCDSLGVGACIVTSANQVDWNGAVTVGATVTITFQVQVKDLSTDMALCVNLMVNYDSDNDGLNDTTLGVNECRSANCLPVGPGLAWPSTAEVSDQKAGSVLVYPFYSSMTAAFNRENTRISLTNIHPQRRAAVHLFFIEDDSGDITDAFLCLTPNQTTSFLISELDPGISGYLIAIATDEQTGCPINFNFLIGDEYVKLSTGHAANLAAEAFAALAGAPVPCDVSASTAELKFDGVQYNAAPRALAVNNLPSPADGNSTLLILDRFGGNLATGLSTVGEIVGLLYNDQETPFSFEFSSGSRQFRAVISNTFPRTTPRVTNIIPSGHSGWLKLARINDGALLGAVINFNPNAALSATAFNQGHNLHKLTLTTDATLIVPVFPPNC